VSAVSVAGDFANAEVLRTRGGGSSDEDVRSFWCKNYRVFRNLLCVHTDKGEVEVSQCEHFADKGRGQFFAILCGHFYGRRAVASKGGKAPLDRDFAPPPLDEIRSLALKLWLKKKLKLLEIKP